MAIAVLVIIVGLIVGVVIELTLSKRRGLKQFERLPMDSQTLKPSTPQVSEPRFVEDGEGFRVLGPVDRTDPGAAPWKSDDGAGGSANSGRS